jgi:hypothetical protein
MGRRTFMCQSIAPSPRLVGKEVGCRTIQDSGHAFGVDVVAQPLIVDALRLHASHSTASLAPRLAYPGAALIGVPSAERMAIKVRRPFCLAHKVLTFSRGSLTTVISSLLPAAAHVVR